MNILISGCGIAGPALAYFLRRAGHRVVIVERSAILRSTGQNIDIRNAGLEVIRRMEPGVEDQIRNSTTHEKGLAFVDRDNKRIAEFAQTGNSRASFTSEIEILRGDLAAIFARQAEKAGTEIRLDNSITSLEEQENGIHVQFDKTEIGELFDAVILADGMNSRARGIVWPNVQLKSLGMYTSYYTIPRGAADEDAGGWARWYNASGGRSILLRPDSQGTTRVFTSVMSDDPRLHGYEDLSVPQQKALYAEFFADAGWEASRVIDGLRQADDFYMQLIAQVHIDKWYHGRVALLGDAGYCPSPITGMGTSVAIVGAYVLAGELSKCGGDYEKAFSEYDNIMRPYVTNAQKLPPGAPAVANPQSNLGISILNSTLSFVQKSGLGYLAAKLGEKMPTSEKLDLPDYDFGSHNLQQR
ncbi:MAG: hypothetical protein Q9227_004336 [Pyrenula ochraceoflavens]